MKTKTTYVNLLAFIWLCLSSLLMNARERDNQHFYSKPIVAEKALQRNKADIDKIISAYSIEEIDNKVIYSFVKKSDNPVIFTLHTSGHTWELNLTRVDLRSHDYRFVAVTDQGNIEFPKTQAVTYRGFANGNSENEVLATICNDFITINIREKTGTYQLEPLSWKSTGTSSNHYIIYNETDFKVNLGCGVVFPEQQIKSQVNHEEGISSNAGVCYSFNAVLYGINSLTTSKGGATATESYLNSVFNLVQSNYMNNHSVELKLTGCVASTSGANDPASSSNYNTYLTNCNTWGNSTKFTSLGAFAAGANLVGVIGSFGSSGIGGVGGVANASSVCVSSKKFMWSSDLTPAYTMTHEWGHMFGCGHDSYTHSNPAYNMNASCGPNSQQTTCTCMMCIVAPPANGQINQGMTRIWSQRSKDLVAAYVATLACKKTCSSVSVPELTKENDGQLLVFPNPSTGIFSVNYFTRKEERANLEVYNLLGEKIYFTSVIFGPGKTETIDLTRFLKGIYMVRVIGERHQAVQQIIHE